MKTLDAIRTRRGARAMQAAPRPLTGGERKPAGAVLARNRF